MSRMPFLKGHGTENDFVLIPDPDGALDERLDSEAVRRIADRHEGIGADGVIRVVRSERIAEGRDLAGEADWFMDYRNADGSIAEMCGNGVRVLAQYLWETGSTSGPVVTIGTRGGVRRVHNDGDGNLTVEMGHAKPAATRQMSFVAASGHTWPATVVSVPNPHAVVFVDSLDEPGRLLTQPELKPASAFPHGANVEFVVAVAERHIAMRVWERGVGETRSCGTGVCAAAWAAIRRDGLGVADPVVVDVPGGRLWVRARHDGELLLTGPAVLGVEGTLTLE